MDDTLEEKATLEEGLDMELLSQMYLATDEVLSLYHNWLYYGGGGGPDGRSPEELKKFSDFFDKPILEKSLKLKQTSYTAEELLEQYLRVAAPVHRGYRTVSAYKHEFICTPTETRSIPTHMQGRIPPQEIQKHKVLYLVKLQDALKKYLKSKGLSETENPELFTRSAIADIIAQGIANEIIPYGGKVGTNLVPLLSGYPMINFEEIGQLMEDEEFFRLEGARRRIILAMANQQEASPVDIPSGVDGMIAGMATGKKAVISSAHAIQRVIEAKPEDDRTELEKKQLVSAKRTIKRLMAEELREAEISPAPLRRAGGQGGGYKKKRTKKRTRNKKRTKKGIKKRTKKGIKKRTKKGTKKGTKKRKTKRRRKTKKY